MCSRSWLKPEAHKIVEAHYRKTLGKYLYPANLCIPINSADSVLLPEQNAALSPPEKEMITFLDEALNRHGAESVLYLSWGTNLAPFTTFWQADVLVDIMVENKRPFVMSQASLASVMNPGLEARLPKGT
ncbi:hypothetical protein CF319_g8655 [Tilletia indica]|nr:hypothetical protein CF319_g8655 [Tilletia indica]